MKINFLKLKKINFKFLIKKQKNFYLYSMEDFLKACNNTDSILLDFTPIRFIKLSFFISYKGRSL